MLPLDDTVNTSRPPLWVFVIIALNAFIFYLELTVANPDAFIEQYALIPALIDFNNWSSLYPFITSQFLHGGWLHILSNMWFLWIFGDNVEERFGFVLFPLIYLLSGVVGAFAQYILMPDSPIPMLGASGAIAGVLGAYFVFFPHHNIKTLVPVFGFFTVANIPAFFILIYWFITQLFAGTFSIGADVGGVAYMAHVGGFATGWIIAKMFPQTSLQRIS